MENKKLLLAPVIIAAITFFSFVIPPLNIVAIFGFFFGSVASVICIIIALVEICRAHYETKTNDLVVAILELIACAIWTFFAFYYFHQGFWGI